MDVERYFERTGDTKHKLSQRVGCSPTTITRSLKGQRSPSLGLARRIEAATDGKISAVEFMAACLAAIPKRQPKRRSAPK